MHDLTNAANAHILVRTYQGGYTMTVEVGVQIAAVVAILAFLWNLHRDVSELRERMARLEGLMEGFVGREPS